MNVNNNNRADSVNTENNLEIQEGVKPVDGEMIDIFLYW